MAMVKSLAEAAEGRPQAFGVKLSNTLEVVNRRPVFPPAREDDVPVGPGAPPAHPHAWRELVDDELDGQVPISFCGGADAAQLPELVADGLAPGHRLHRPPQARRLRAAAAVPRQPRRGAWTAPAPATSTPSWPPPRAGAARAATWPGTRAQVVADGAATPGASARWPSRARRPLGPLRLHRRPVPGRLPRRTRTSPTTCGWSRRGARPRRCEVILRTNPQPGVTGSICDHPCTERCVRNFYDAPLAIREIKRFAFEHGEVPAERAGRAHGPSGSPSSAPGRPGCRPRTTSRAMGFEPDDLRGQGGAGRHGDGRHPRLPALPAEPSTATSTGSGSSACASSSGKALGRDVTLDELRRDYAYVFLAVGAQRGKRLGIPGEDADGVVDALEFLDGCSAGPSPGSGRRVLVVGGGNSAMDAARAARRVVRQRGAGDPGLPPHPRRHARRSRRGARLPSSRASACATCSAPARVVAENGRVAGLACTRMKPGRARRLRPAAAGARRGSRRSSSPPTPSSSPSARSRGSTSWAGWRSPAAATAPSRSTRRPARPRSPACSPAATWCAAPSSVIKAIADGRAVAEEIGRPPRDRARAGAACSTRACAASQLMAKKALAGAPADGPGAPGRGAGRLRRGHPGASSPRRPPPRPARCLDCDDLCSLCVTVCPNRANLAYATAPLSLALPDLRRPGRPAARRTQPTPFCGRAAGADPEHRRLLQRVRQLRHLLPHLRRALQGEADLLARRGRLRRRRRATPSAWSGSTGPWCSRRGWRGRSHRLERRDGVAEYRSEQVRARLSAGPWTVVECEPAGPLADGERVDLSTCATLIALLEAEPALPASRSTPRPFDELGAQGSGRVGSRLERDR